MPFWKREPVGFDELYIYLNAEDLTIVDGTGSETMPDRDVTDGQENNLVVDWDYTPPGGAAKPAFDGTKLSGLMQGYGTLLTGNAVPGVFPAGSEFWFQSHLSLTSGGNVSYCAMTAGAGSSGYSVLISIPNDSSDLLIQVQATNGVSPVATTMYSLPQGEDHQIGAYFEPIDGSSHNIHLIIDGVIVESAVASFGIVSPDSWTLPSAVYGGADLTEMDFYSYEFYTKPLPDASLLTVHLLASDIPPAPGTVTWLDLALSDGQANNVSFDWSATGGDLAVIGSYLEGYMESFPNAGTSGLGSPITITPVGAAPFTASMELTMAVLADYPGMSSVANVFTILLGGGVESGGVDLRGILLGDRVEGVFKVGVGFQQLDPVYDEQQVFSAPLALGTTVILGMTVTPGSGEFTVALSVDGVPVDSVICARPLEEITSAQLFRSGLSMSDAQMRFYEFNLAAS